MARIEALNRQVSQKKQSKPKNREAENPPKLSLGRDRVRISLTRQNRRAKAEHRDTKSDRLRQNMGRPEGPRQINDEQTESTDQKLFRFVKLSAGQMPPVPILTRRDQSGFAPRARSEERRVGEREE